MNIVVCVKQVPSTNEVRLDPVTNTIIRDGRQSVINPFDTYALEEAVRIREKLGGEVVVLSMGIPSVEGLLRDACSCGADRGVLLSDRAFAGADTLATSYALSLWLHKYGKADLIICGKMAVDGDTAQIGPELASQLEIPYITDVDKIVSVDEESITVRKSTDFGHMVLKSSLPALITVVKDINMPRMATIPGVKAGLSAKIDVFTAAELGADENQTGLTGSPTQVVRTFTPDRDGDAILISGSATEMADEISEIIKGAL